MAYDGGGDVFAVSFFFGHFFGLLLASWFALTAGKQQVDEGEHLVADVVKSIDRCAHRTDGLAPTLLGKCSSLKEHRLIVGDVFHQGLLRTARSTILATTVC